ncbi:MAG: Ldh family oxidoreductase [Planctomycetaceae bacterium]
MIDQRFIEMPHDPEQETLVPEEGLQALLVALLNRKGMFAAEAEIGAARMVEADLRGLHSHGSRMVRRYIEAMDQGDIDPRAQIVTLCETPAVAVLDGGRGLGHVAATRAMQLAIEKARAVGTGTVVVKNGQHLGANAVYVQLAIDAGMIGECVTSSGKATVAAYGSRQPATSNHALAWGVPTRNGPPFLLDMACAESSWGKIRSLALYGQPLPMGWALDADGRGTTDPRQAATLLPAAGPRGFGLGILAGVLAGALAGGKLPIHKRREYLSEPSEHFLQAIDPGRFVEPDRFFKQVDSALADVRALEPASDFERVRLPGQRQWERLNAAREHGIPLHHEHVQKLRNLAGKMNVSVPW